MSEVTQNAENNMLTSNYSVKKIFVWNNRFQKATFTNSSGASVTLEAGLVLGQIATTRKLVELDPAGTDGSQYPIGVLAETVTLANGASADLTYCVEGDVAESELVMPYGVALTDVIEDKTLRQRIASDTVGINLVGGTEMTSFDNA